LQAILSYTYKFMCFHISTYLHKIIVFSHYIWWDRCTASLIGEWGFIYRYGKCIWQFALILLKVGFIKCYMYKFLSSVVCLVACAFHSWEERLKCTRYGYEPIIQTIQINISTNIIGFQINLNYDIILTEKRVNPTPSY
jgi:hypothetical protein